MGRLTFNITVKNIVRLFMIAEKNVPGMNMAGYGFLALYEDMTSILRKGKLSTSDVYNLTKLAVDTFNGYEISRSEFIHSISDMALLITTKAYNPNLPFTIIENQIEFYYDDIHSTIDLEMATYTAYERDKLPSTFTNPALLHEASLLSGYFSSIRRIR